MPVLMPVFVCTHTEDGTAERFGSWVDLMKHIATHPERASLISFKRPYKPPTLTFLGTVGDLTKNIGAPSTIPGMPPGFPHP